MLKKLITSIFLGLCLFAGLEMSAAPAVPYPVTMKQPDGTEITVKLKGDENVNWMESMDGYSLMYGKDKSIVYAIQNEKGDMVPSDVVFQEATLKSTELSAFLGGVKKGLRYSPSQIEVFRKISEIEQKTHSSSSPNLRATVGQAKAICALIGFSDKPFTHTVAEFEQLMNQVGYSANGAKGSVQDFYKENSYGKLELVVTVVGPYTAANELKYYGEKNGNQNDKNARELAQEAATFAFNDPAVNPADYDNDGDGLIDTFHFLYAGYGQEAGGGEDCIWAHKSGFSPALTFGTKRLSIYSCSPELRGNSGNNVTNIGVICHELCHVFGAPDYYDTNDEQGGDFLGTGNWDLMAGGSWNGPSGSNTGGISPAHINMYQKIVFGWVTPTELAAEATVSGMLNSAENPVAYIVRTTTPGEYFILENRQRVKFDTNVPGSGLLIYRVSSKASGNSVSNSTHPQQVYPVCASSMIAIPNSDPSSYGSINSSGCPFPGSTGNTAFSDYSTPSAKSWAGNNTSRPITEIKEENQLVSFSFMKSGATVSNVSTTVSGQNVTISWNAPQGAVPDKYAIYRNDQTLIILENGSAESYTQYGVSAGTYTYCVAPVYGNLESSKQCAPAVTVSGPAIDCPPVKNLIVMSVADRVKLSWSPDFDGGWITHSGDVSYMRGYNVKTFTVASRWTVDDLSKMRGSTLTKVRFFPTESACEYTIKVWSSSPNSLTPTLLSEERVSSFTISSLKEVNLSKPVRIEDSNIEYWIGLECNITSAVTTGVYPAASDGGPGVPLRNLVQTTSTWSYITGDFNWSIAGFLEAPELKTTETTGSWVTPSGDVPQQPTEEMPVYSEAIPAVKLLPSQDRLKAAALSGYKVYRDGDLLATVKTKYYTDMEVSPGNYVYCVSSVYGDCESEQVCGSAISIVAPEKYPPVSNVSALANGWTTALTWEKPEERGGQIRYSSQTRAGGLGSNASSLDFIVAIRYPAGDLMTQNGSKLTKVRFMPGNINSTYSIRVWKGGNALAPGELLIDQPVRAVQANVWQEVVLVPAINLDIYEELWIGVRCISTSGQFPASYDNTAAVVGKGDMLYINNQWQHASGAVAGFDSNWCIEGVLEPISSLWEYAYAIYRDGVFQGYTKDLFYGQAPMGNGTYLYEVVAKYHDGDSRKEGVNVTVSHSTGTEKVLVDNLVNIFPNPIARGGILTLDLGAENTSAEVLFYSLSGQMVKKESLRNKTTQFNIDLPSGTYLMQVRLGNGKVNTLKLIVN